jgi:hypothetical protein
MDEAVADSVRSALDGHAHALERLGIAHRTLRKAAASMSPLVLTRGELTRVLCDRRDGRISPRQAQRWASSMRRGYVSAESSAREGPIRPIEITYEDDDAIVEPLGRLDELGDVTAVRRPVARPASAVPPNPGQR